MKKQVINYNWPASLSFSADNKNDNERFSRGKLAVFFKGETADHRFFSDEFSKTLIESLPYTPIVSHYDEQADDFVGHATEQDIYGIVDPCGEITFEEREDGNIWCVCDTVYYTERPDKVGTIAKKIEGHSQSLELDPSTVKYVVNYDERRHFKNIEFTAGKFIGVSVLGNDQKPAFTGSSFFSCEDFDAKMKILKDYCNKQNGQNGGNNMNLQEFMKLSWGDISTKVEEALQLEYENEAFIMLADMFEDSAIVHFYSYLDNTHKLMRVKYSCDENGVVTLGAVNEVHVTYEDVPTVEIGEKQATTDDFVGKSKKDDIDDPDDIDDINDPDDSDDSDESYDPEDDEEKDDDMVCKKDKQQDEDMVCGPDKEKEDDMVCDPDKKEKDDMICDPEDKKDKESKDMVCNPDDKEKKDDMVCKDPEKRKTECEVADATCATCAEVAQVLDAEITPETKKVSVENEQTQEENSSSTSFAESERAEFEALKREKKVNLLDSYKDYLTDEEYNNFAENINSFELNALEMELLKKYKAYTEKTPKTMRAFALSSPFKENAKQGLDDVVRKYLSK